MKEKVILIILIIVLTMSMAGCNSNNKNLNSDMKAATTKPNATQDMQRNQNTDDKKETDINNTPVITIDTTTEPIKTLVPTQTSVPIIAPSQTTSIDAKAIEFFNDTPLAIIDVIHITPKHVYYKDSVLYMEAFVYNGFSHKVFNVRNITIRLSNNSEVIAEGIFSGLGNTAISPNSYILWIFKFEAEAVIKQNADLNPPLRTEVSSVNSY